MTKVTPNGLQDVLYWIITPELFIIAVNHNYHIAKNQIAQLYFSAWSQADNVRGKVIKSKTIPNKSRRTHDIKFKSQKPRVYLCGCEFHFVQ